jgi:hypothetical protein
MRETMTTWKPIDTAPLDGTRVLLAMSPQLSCDAVQIGYAADTALWGLCWRFDGEYTVEAPAGATHWMPLPDPPTRNE